MNLSLGVELSLIILQKQASLARCENNFQVHTATETVLVASVHLRLANGCFAVTSADSLRAQNDSIDFSFVGMIKGSLRFSP